MTIKEYEAKLREIDKDSIFGQKWNVSNFRQNAVMVTNCGAVQFVIYDLKEQTGAWLQPSMNTDLFSNGGLDRTIKILQETNEFIKSYED